MHMTKVEAVKAFLKKQGGAASWNDIYGGIEEFYPKATVSKFWQEGIRGVVYREIRAGANFKMTGKGIVSLTEHNCDFSPQMGDAGYEGCDDCGVMRREAQIEVVGR